MGGGLVWVVECGLLGAVWFAWFSAPTLLQMLQKTAPLLPQADQGLA